MVGTRIMQSRRDFSMLQKVLMCITVFPLFNSTVCKAGELSESGSLFSFIRAVDPKNALGIEWNGFIPHPCSNHWKSIKCSLGATTITEVRLENLSLCGIIDAKSLCKLPKLRHLSLAKNQIHGSIPDSISKCTSLKHLDLSNNLLNGTVPVALTKLKNLRRLDISNNHFSKVAQYPKQESRLPNSYATNSSALQSNASNKAKNITVAPSPQLDVYGHEQRHHKAHEKWKSWMPVVFGIAFFVVLIFFVNMKAAKLANDKEILKALAHSPLKSPPTKTTDEVKPEERCSDLVFFVGEEERFKKEDLLEAAADLKSQGFFGSLYKVQLNNNALFAVKRLKKLQVSFEEFGQTMRRIGNLKHRNILPLVGYNSTDEEKLLIYKYQRNGSLLTLLENYINGKRDFPWKLRLSIAIGIARGLDFIYQKCGDWDIIPHGNIKLSNILLNENEEPLISEYGYLKFFDPMTACLFNSNGYTAPEKILSEKADVFSFGVILLELLTGKLVEKSGLDLPKWVRSMVREEWTGEVFDGEIAKVEMYAFPLLNISLKCVADFPQERPTVAEVLEKIEEVVNEQEDLSTPMTSTESNPQDCCSLHYNMPETPGSKQ
ncbi:unnamed protein product [Ilex paraguariensis]|uniref:Protein kinase domain-containing protein n=1 Tax=Ilex paraguariensis TaxID=185542 RepID=A0ABC8T3B0_9AQUA